MRVSAWLTVALVVIATTVFAAEKTIEKTFEVSPGGLLSVNVDMGSIEIQGTDGPSARITVTFKSDRWDEDKLEEMIRRFKLDMDHQGNDISVRLRSREHEWGNRSKHLWVQVEVQLPRKFRVKAETAGGSISVKDLDGEARCHTSGGELTFVKVLGPVWGETSGGSINLTETQKSAHIETSGGSITFEKTADVFARTSGGSIEAGDFDGPIDAETSGGFIRVQIPKQLKGDASFSTSGGDIEAELAQDIHAELEAGTSGGRFSTDFPITIQGQISKEHVQAKINGGGPRLTLNTSGGNIHIKKLNPDHN